ncbi:hypothetical protein B0920_04095 [Massilia sp. KIM]|uniref:hypothetical protein n=1 Tax=Massilia sp. KIM TaxID=1955422 RepID=UPI00098EB7D2|nr:hypothetical protein [Massilia sp. KIM]OON62632.1 hypothetical protein B0920_04095 [Massilia sp. KIM]
MHHSITPGALALAGALLLAGCGGGTDDPHADLPAVSRVEVLSSAKRGMESIVVRGGSAYVSLANSATEGSAVLKATLPISARSSWTVVPLGNCGLGPVGEFIVRSPKLKMAGETMWLMQPSDGGEEHSTCTMAPQATSFAPADQGLRACTGDFCTTLWMTDLKAVGNRLYSNAGAGENVLTSGDGGASWRVVRGQFDSMVCTHTSFHVIGDRLLVGGECPLDDAFLDAYQLSADGASLLKPEKLPMSKPVLENRNIQFIESIPGTQRVFVGVEGGLLRSEDGGKSFKFVIHNPVNGNLAYPYIKSFISLKASPDTILVGGFDKRNGKPYLAYSRDAGGTWTDLSASLPNYAAPAGDNGEHGLITDIAEDAEGRILITYNERFETEGRLLQLSLGRR